MRQKILSMFVLVVLAVAIPLAFMGTTYTYTSQTVVASGQSATGASWQFGKLTHTFVATTDTAIFYFRVNRPTAQLADSTLFEANVGVKGTDSVRVVWSYSYSYDGLAWTSLALGTDSSAANGALFSSRHVVIGRTIWGSVPGGAAWPPYNRIRAIGSTLATGVNNKVGNQARVALVRAS